MKLNEKYFKIKREAHNLEQQYRKNGVWGAFLYLAKLTVKHSKKVLCKKDCYTFFELDLRKSSSDDETDTTLNACRMSRNDIENDYNDGWYDQNLAIKKLEKGDILLGVKESGKFIFCQWFAFNKVHLPGINLFFTIPDTTAYMAYIYTSPEYRDQGVASRTTQYSLNYLKNNRYLNVFVLINPDNQSSIRVNRKAGFKEYQTLFYTRFLLFVNLYHLKDSASNRKKKIWSIGKTDQMIWKIFSKLQINHV